MDLKVWVVEGGGAMDSFLRDAEWGREENLCSPNSQATPQGLDERLKVESVDWS